MGCEIDYDNRVSGIISLYSYNVAYVLSIESNGHVVLEEHERHGDRIAFGQPTSQQSNKIKWTLCQLFMDVHKI